VPTTRLLDPCCPFGLTIPGASRARTVGEDGPASQFIDPSKGGGSKHVPTEADCLDALHRAADHLGHSPSKAQYERLGLTPASATIVRILGGWNDAKTAAGLETATSSGPRVEPPPAGVDDPANRPWESLTADQRWHYRNRDHNADRTHARRARHRSWLNQFKADRGCARCAESDPACLDFHHLDSDDKTMNVSQMVSHGYSLEKIQVEIEGCAVLCANCHRKEHHTPPAVADSASPASLDL
jgi:hypothetical protein